MIPHPPRQERVRNLTAMEIQRRILHAKELGAGPDVEFEARYEDGGMISATGGRWSR